MSGASAKKSSRSSLVQARAYNQSRIKSFRRCQRQYGFRYDFEPGKELVPRVSSTPLHRGSWMHALQEVYFKGLAEDQGFDAEMVWGTSETKEGEVYIPCMTWEEEHDRRIKLFNGLFDEEKEKLGFDLPNNCYRLFKGYLRVNEEADQEKFRVASLPDGSPGIEFVVEWDLSPWKVTSPFKGRIDRLIEDLEYGGLWIWDAKWMKNIPGPDERVMNPQSSLYVGALRYGMGLDVRGFVYDYGRTKAPTIPEPVKRGSAKTPSGCITMKDGLDTDYWTYLRAIRDHHGDDAKHYVRTVYKQKLKELKARDILWYRRERIPVEDFKIKQSLREFIMTVRQIERRASFEASPRSFFYNCRFNCDYYSPCTAMFSGLDIRALVKQQYVVQEERYTEEDLLSA